MVGHPPPADHVLARGEERQAGDASAQPEQEEWAGVERGGGDGHAGREECVEVQEGAEGGLAGPGVGGLPSLWGAAGVPISDLD